MKKIVSVILALALVLSMTACGNKKQEETVPAVEAPASAQEVLETVWAMYTVGLRYGFTSFEYDVQAPPLADPNWGGTSIPVDFQGVKSNVHWAEAVVGLKANVLKNFYMGFSVRYRMRLSMTKNENSEPYQIPGFGKGKNNFGIAYNLVYKLPF